MEQMNTITVLDFTTGKVTQYNAEKWGIDKMRLVDFLEEMGHKTNDCQWMIHEDATVYIDNNE